MTRKNPAIGSSYDDFLADGGMLEAASAVTIKRVIAMHGHQYMTTTDITHAVIKRAESRMAKAQRRGRAITASYDAKAKRVVVDLDTGLSISFHCAEAQGLAGASQSDLAAIQITPSGLGLHWPKLDADLYLPALLEGLLGSKKWLAAKLGAAGGRARSQAKTISARENGRLGGWPRKVARS